MMSEIKNQKMTKACCAMTVDVEDYFHVAAFNQKILPSEWGKKYPFRVEENTERILELFETFDVKATFFILGWVAKACPNLVKTIVSHGHELASHGFNHQLVTKQSEREFYHDIYQSKALLEDLSGTQIRGYRAPSFSINQSNEWAFRVLADVGFIYSSSTYPVKHDLYGSLGWPKFKHLRTEGIIEIPIPTLTRFGKNIPIGGGGFFRLYPYKLSKWLIENFIQQTRLPYSFYFHPWEIDAQQPRIKDVSFKSHFRHYLNLSKMEDRIKSLLTDFSWDTISNVYQINGRTNDTSTTDQKNDTSRYVRLGQVCR